MHKKIAVLLLCLLPAALTAWTDAPLTVEEAAAYIQADPAGAAEDIAKLDAIEHAVPVVTLPAAAVIVTGRDVAVAWQGGVDVTIAGVLHYRITLEPVVARGVVSPPLEWWVVPAWTVGGVVAGWLLTCLATVLAAR